VERVISFIGLFTMIGLAWLMSSHKRAISVRLVVGGLVLQFALAAILLRDPFAEYFFGGVDVFFSAMLGFVNEGAGFLFHIIPRQEDPTLPPAVTLLRTFACGVLPTIIFFSSFMSVMYHLGIMQWIVTIMGRAMQWTLRVSGAESLAAAANVFVGHTEAPLVVKPYIAQMTTSELNAMMVGGFATISGGLLAAYAGMGISPGHLVTASVISAPAALLIAKVMQPETGKPATLGTVKATIERKGVNVIEAATIGATDGLKLALNVAAMLIAFLALIAMINALLGWLGGLFGFVGPAGQPLWSLEAGLGYLFAPLAWLMGIESGDCLEAGQLLGIKMAANEFLAYQRLGEWVSDTSTVQISARTECILTYALSGFSNFGAIGIQIGGIGGLVPERRSDLARLGLRAMVGGALACSMTACIAGILV
jgi:CNT family concentrative nucleoside transporter